MWNPWLLSEETPSASAMTHRCSQLKPDAFEAIFHSFNSSARDLRPSDNNSQYRFLAADGSSISFFSFPRYAADKYFSTQGNSAKGWYALQTSGTFLHWSAAIWSAAVARNSLLNWSIQPVTVWRLAEERDSAPEKIHFHSIGRDTLDDFLAHALSDEGRARQGSGDDLPSGMGAHKVMLQPYWYDRAERALVVLDSMHWFERILLPLSSAQECEEKVFLWLWGCRHIRCHRIVLYCAVTSANAGVQTCTAWPDAAAPLL